MPTNPGVTNLVSYWSLDETSGTRVDSHGSDDLTDTNTVLSATGVQGNAADFETTNTEYLTKATPAAHVSGAHTVCGWVNYESFSNSYGTLFTDSLLNTTSGGVRVRVLASGLLQYQGSTGSAIVTLSQSGFIPAASTWYFVAFWHDGVNTYSAQLDLGTIYTAAGAAPAAGTGALLLGAGLGGGVTLDGMMDEWCVFNRELTADERSFLYNSGAGVTYATVAGSAGMAQPLSGPFARALRGAL